MLVCPSCNNEQDSGKFCGKCGTQLEEKVVQEEGPEQEVEESSPEDKEKEDVSDRKEEVQPAGEEAQANEQRVATAQPTQEQSEFKENIANYGSYFMSLIKNPTLAINHNQSHFTYGIINVILYVLTFSFSIYFALNSAFKMGMFYMGQSLSDSLPVFPIISRVSISILIIIAAIIGAIILISVIASRKIDYSQFIAKYGGVITPIILLNVLTMLTGLSNSFGWTAMLLSISFMFALYIAPGIIIYDMYSFGNRDTQKVYLGFGTMILAMFVTYIVGKIFITKFLEDVLESLSPFLGNLF